MSDNESDDDERKSQLILTLVPTIAGVAAGVVSSVLATGATDMVGVLVLGALTISSVGVGRVTTKRDFSVKDYLYITFLTGFSWFIVWAAILTTTA